MRLAIVGSRAFNNRDRVRQIVEKYITQYGADNLSVVSGGCPKGADFLGKQVALELGLLYKEHAPAHAKYNEYCVLSPDNYGKSYHVGNFFQRNTQVAENCDHLIAFVIKDVRCNGTMDTVNKARKLGKQVFVFEEE